MSRLGTNQSLARIRRLLGARIRRCTIPMRHQRDVNIVPNFASPLPAGTGSSYGDPYQDASLSSGSGDGDGDCEIYRSDPAGDGLRDTYRPSASDCALAALRSEAREGLRDTKRSSSSSLRAPPGDGERDPASSPSPSRNLIPSAFPSLLCRKGKPSVSSNTLLWVSRGSWMSQTRSSVRRSSTKASIVVTV